ncbi:MAG: peptidoglycan D,D-transpeptidase FtsI family protein [Coraliomargaritaceae bacterium]
MSKAFVSSFRSSLVCVLVGFAFCVLIGRLVHLHVIGRSELLAYVEKSRKMVQLVEARRGNIVDRQGNLLATTHTTINLGVDPQSVEEADWVKLPQLAELLGQPLEKVQSAFQRKSRSAGDGREVRLIRWASLAKDLSEDVYETVMGLKIKGLYGNRNFTRTYPGGRLAAHVLGFVNKEETPVCGIERSFDYYLRGQDGWRETERDGRRREVARFREREVAPSNGLNVELSIDQMVQHIVEREIDRLVEDYDPDSVSILVSEPATGYLLAMANYPTFNLNEYFDTAKHPLANQRNRALTDIIEPGSTFKIVPAAAALNEGVARSDDVFKTGLAKVEYKGRNVSLPKDHGRGYEQLSLHGIVMKSSNRGAAHLGMLLGEERLRAYASAFGFGEKSGINLSGEVPGILHAVKDWDGLTITRMPMGHAVSATPIQIHNAMAVVANGGVFMKPQVVKRVFDSRSEEIVYFSPKARRRVLSSETAEEVSKMLVDVVGPEGTARKAHIENFRVAGKTGTTQKIVNGRYSHSQHVASFSGFFPADNPALVITVIVDHPKFDGLGYGGSVSGPAFRNIANACINHLGIRPSGPDVNSIALQHSYYELSGRYSD